MSVVPCSLEDPNHSYPYDFIEQYNLLMRPIRILEHSNLWMEFLSDNESWMDYISFQYCSLSHSLHQGKMKHAHNCQKWNRWFFTCHCNKIYRGWSSSFIFFQLYILKIMIVVSMWNLRQFVNDCFIQFWILKCFCTHVAHFIST